MPRVETPHLPEDRETRDLCASCYRSKVGAYEAAGWETEVAHPPYGEWSDDGYACYHCGDELSWRDNLVNMPPRR